MAEVSTLEWDKRSRSGATAFFRTFREKIQLARAKQDEVSRYDRIVLHELISREGERSIAYYQTIARYLVAHGYCASTGCPPVDVTRNVITASTFEKVRWNNFFSHKSDTKLKQKIHTHLHRTLNERCVEKSFF